MLQNFSTNRMISSVGRASDSRPEGHRFKSGIVQLLHVLLPITLLILTFAIFCWTLIHININTLLPITTNTPLVHYVCATAHVHQKIWHLNTDPRPSKIIWDSSYVPHRGLKMERTKSKNALRHSYISNQNKTNCDFWQCPWHLLPCLYKIMPYNKYEYSEE